MYNKDSLMGLKQALYKTVTDTVPETATGIAFSGGVDSSLLVKICLDLGKKITLLTIGFHDSHDIIFSKDIASRMNLPQKISIITYDNDFLKNLNQIIGIIKCKNTSHIENCLAYFYISKLASENDIDLVLSANGCDELFCGYNGYRIIYDKGEEEIKRYMDEKIENEFSLIKEIATVADRFNVHVKQPFLSEQFIKFSKLISIDQKIKGCDDMIRKHILRQVALSIGVPRESAMKPKKALQYGSLIHKYFKRSYISL